MKLQVSASVCVCVSGDKYKQIIFLVEIENWDNPL